MVNPGQPGDTKPRVLKSYDSEDSRAAEEAVLTTEFIFRKSLFLLIRGNRLFYEDMEVSKNA